jgi:hypothetical protein
MADGDVTAVVNADGWSLDVTIEGSGGGVDWGAKAGTVSFLNQSDRYSFGNVDFGPTNFKVNLTSQGYSGGVLGTTARLLFGTSVVRKPYSVGGDELDIDETAATNNLTIRISLSECIYDDDTSVTITVTAGWASDSGDDSNLATSVAVTNNSTLDYPKVIGQWDWASLRNGWRRQESDFNVGFRARHGYGIDQVTISAIGASSAVDTNSDVASLSKSQSPASLLYHESFKMPVTIASYTQGEQIDLRAIAYPLVGDADSLLDTNSVTDIDDRIRGLTTCFMICDKTEALKDYAIVDADFGDDGTGANSTTLATARLNPFLTIMGAIESGATIVYVKNTSAVPDILGEDPSGPITNGYYVEVSEDPDDTGIELDRSGTWPSYATDFLCYLNIGITMTAGGLINGADLNRQIAFENVVFNNAFAPTVGLGDKSKGCWFLDCLNMGTDDYLSSSTDRNAYSFTGNTFTSVGACDCAYTFIANKSSGVDIKLDHKLVANPAPTQNNVIIEHNQHYGTVANAVTNAWLQLGTLTALDDVAVIGNIVEVESVTLAGPILWLFGDGSTQIANNIIVAHNTLVGERCNLFYNDTGVASVLRTNIFCYGNAFRSYNIKSDTLVSDPNANRVGNWAQMWSVNYHDNVYDGSSSSLFAGEFFGVRNDFELTGGFKEYGQLKYFNEQSFDLGGAGDGDYLPVGNSLLLGANIKASEEFIAFDSFGTKVSNTIGAVFITEGSAIQLKDVLRGVISPLSVSLIAPLIAPP